jgi:hypothetical protein
MEDSMNWRFILGQIGIIITALMASPTLADPVQPTFSASDFVPGAPINNPFFPLMPGTVFRESAQVTDPDTGESRMELDENTVTFQTKPIGGVTARVVRAKVFFDGLLGEDTFDYYAQDKTGNVWYLGEDTTEFQRNDQGNVTGTDTSGSWRTGGHGDWPGFNMPANLTVGFSYFQENAPADEAIDQAQIVSLNETVSVPFGNFTNVLKTLETSSLEPDVLEAKFYARGVGEILVWENIDQSGQPLNRIPLVSVSTSSIPLPPAAWAALLTIASFPLARARSIVMRCR